MQLKSKTLAATLAAGTILATTAWAQFGGLPAPNAAGGPTGGGPNAGGPNPFGGAPNQPGNNPFGNSRPRFAVGTVASVDPTAATVTLTSVFGEAKGQTVKVTDATQIMAQTEAKVGDLKVGEMVKVRGVPTAITASQIAAGDDSDPMLSDMGMVGDIQPGGKAPLGVAAAQAGGKITSLNPLTLSVSDSVSVVLTAAPDARVTRMVAEKIGSIKAGDHIMANGQTGDDGVLTATRIRLNLDSEFGLPAASMPMPTSAPAP